jgi:hypothetical protein
MNNQMPWPEGSVFDMWRATIVDSRCSAADCEALDRLTRRMRLRGPVIPVDSTSTIRAVRSQRISRIGDREQRQDSPAQRKAA